MIGTALTKIFWFVLSIPVRILFAIRFSAIFTLLGFIVGLLAGILAGYYFFIYTEAFDDEEVKPLDIAEREFTPEEKKRMYKLLPPWVHSPDFERVGWFNKMMHLMWPYIDKAVKAEVIAQATPIIEKNKPSFIESIDFEQFTLGTLSPAFVGIKSFQTMEDEVIIQPEMRWVGRPNIKVVVKVFGIRLSAHVSYLSIEAPVRVTLKPLVDYFPCFSKIVVSLMSSPKVDVGLSILGLDFLVIPFVSKLVDAQVESAVGDMLLWPQTMKIFDDEAKPLAGKLIIRDIGARKLKNIVGLVGTIDPYVRFGFGKKIGNFQTSVVKDSTDPVWTEEGVVGVREGAQEEEGLLVEVFHRKKPKDVLIGEARVHLADIMQNPSRTDVQVTLMERVEKAVEATADPNAPAPAGPPKVVKSATSKRAKAPREVGTVHFSMEYKERKVQAGDDADEEEDEEIIFDEKTKVGGGKLWVKLRSGKELEAKKSDYNYPTVFLKFRGEEKKSQKYKESDVDIFDDLAFTWDCMDFKPDNDTLHVRVIAESKGPSVSNPLTLKRLLHSQEPVGEVDIPLRDVVANGRVLDDFSLVGSKGSTLKVEIRWKEKTKDDA